MRIDILESDKFNNKNRYAGSYLHGKIESDYGHDIFSFARKQKFDTGIHHFVLTKEDNTEIDATFFLWKTELRISEWAGLLVYSSDEEAYNYALKSYNEKEDCL